MQSLFEEVRAAASRRAWSRGVELARGGAVTTERVDAREAQLRVAVPGEPVAARVTLLLDADAWSCDCPGVDDPCEHVAAAVIALRRAREDGRELQAASGARLRYELRRTAEGIALERFAVRDGAAPVRIEASVAAIASARVAGPALIASASDLAVDDALDASRGGLLSRGGRRSHAARTCVSTVSLCASRASRSRRALSSPITRAGASCSASS